MMIEMVYVDEEPPVLFIPPLLGEITALAIPGVGPVTICVHCKGSTVCGCNFCPNNKCPHCSGLGLRRLEEIV